MSIGFNWFKDIRVNKEVINYGIGTEESYKLEYLGGGNTSHSAGNIIKLQKIFEEYEGIRIPSIDIYNVNPETIKEEFIEPKVISDICNKFLNTPDELDEYDMRDRIEWIKELSDEGYYISYDCD